MCGSVVGDCGNGDSCRLGCNADVSEKPAVSEFRQNSDDGGNRFARNVFILIYESNLHHIPEDCNFKCRRPRLGMHMAKTWETDLFYG